MNESDSQLLMRYIDGECTPDERTALEARLKDDPQAANELEQLTRQQATWQQMPSTLTEAEVETDWDALEKKILTGEATSPRKREVSWMAWSELWTWGAAAAVFALASIVFFLPRSEATSVSTQHVVDVVETDLEQAPPIIYQDRQSGWTVIWVDEAAAS